MSKFLIALARIFYGVAKIVGIIPFSYSFKRRIASTSTFWRCYTLMILIAITVFTPLNIRTIYSRMHFLKQQPLLSFVGINRFVVLHLCAIFTVLIQLLKDQDVIYCCNEAIRIFDSLRSLPTDCDGMTFDRSLVFRLLAKVVTLLPITQMIVFYITHDGAMQDPKFFFSLMMVYYCQLMLIMTFNMFYGATLILTAFKRHLNRSLERIFREIRALKRHPGRANSLKMQKYCEFADVLDKMMDFHRKIVALGKIINQQYQVQIVCYVLYVAIESVVQCYIMYFVVTNMRSRGDRDAKSHLGAVANVLAWLLDLVLVISATESLAEQSAETKWIVRIGEEVDSVDVRLERTFEYFSIYLHCEKVAFTACGLFDVDNRCLFMLCQRLLTFMLILIQFDTILNYNRKMIC